MLRQPLLTSVPDVFWPDLNNITTSELPAAAYLNFVLTKPPWTTCYDMQHLLLQSTERAHDTTCSSNFLLAINAFATKRG